MSGIMLLWRHKELSRELQTSHAAPSSACNINMLLEVTKSEVLEGSAAGVIEQTLAITIGIPRYRGTVLDGSELVALFFPKLS